MSLDLLRKALVQMPATGEEGFEGLAATLLSALTHGRFFIARSGDQPADALGKAGDVAMQGKRYDKKRLNETEFEGDFYKACRLCPTLDCYVLATSRPSAQLNALAQDLQARTGVDIILLQFDTLESELPALCVAFWERIKDFRGLAELDATFEAWAIRESERPEIKTIVETVRCSLTESVPLAMTVVRKLKSYLHGRFGIDRNPSRPSRFRIDLRAAVPRRQPHQKLKDWWEQRKTRGGAAIGEEGMGKSWVASAFSLEMIENSDALVFWLDSADWAGLTRVESVMDAGLLHTGFSDHDLRKRLVRKCLTRWSNRLLLVLDGVNERSARDTAHHLLAEVHAADEPPCRLLFTTRPIAWRSDERSLWNSVTAVSVGRFTEEELQEALARLTVPVRCEEIPPGLLDVARVPRYFLRAVELRERFKSFTNVSKEMVLWSDLLAKLDAGDPQLIDRIGWTSPADIKRALLKLASAARLLETKSHTHTESYAILQSCFGDKFEQIRADLEEQRIVLEPVPDALAPSPEHLVLGFALHLGVIANRHASQSIADLADRIHRELEPILSQDQITEALYVALQLSALPNLQGHTVSSPARSALLLAWTSSQNSRVSLERLHFWAHHDLPAYLDFIEELFIEAVSDAWETALIEPLKEIWRTESETLSVLGTRLRRWVKLLWRSEELPTASEIVIRGVQLPVARSSAQLALSMVSLAILSERPCPSFLIDLATAWGTARDSTQRHRFPRTPAGPVEETRDLPCKDVHYNLGALLRWRYTESIKPEIETLQRQYPSDHVVSKGCASMILTFDEFGWVSSSNYLQELRTGTPLYHENPNRFTNCPELAVRDDLPELHPADKSIIANRIERVFTSGQLHVVAGRTFEDRELECYLPWFARSNPSKLAELGTKFRLTALSSSVLGLALGFANHLPYSELVLPPGELFKKAKQSADRECDVPASNFSWSLLQLHALALTCFGEAELWDWLLFASERKLMRREIHVYPMPLLCSFLLPNTLAALARKEAQSCCDEPEDNSRLTQSEFDFWAFLGGVSGEPDAIFHRWVTEQILSRNPTKDRRFYWLLLWFRSAPQEALEKAAAKGTIVQLLSDDGTSAMRLADRDIANWGDLGGDFDDLIRVLPIDDAGTALSDASRDTDLDRWGHLLFNKALELVGLPPFDRTFWGSTIHQFADSGRIVGSSCGRQSATGVEEPTGVRPPKMEFGVTFLRQQSLPEVEQKANAAIKVWHQDQDRLKVVEQGSLDRFDALYPLRAWRDRQPDAFHDYAERLLRRAMNEPGKSFHIGGFLVAVITCLVPLDPDLALQSYTAFHNGSLRVDFINHYEASLFSAALWRGAAAANQRCEWLCLDLCQRASTDEKLMSYAITAQAEGAANVLKQICQRLLKVDVAKERCLAISLLAWMSGKEEIGILEELVNADQSGWVRAHAQWAVEVAKQEASARRFYARTCEESDPNVVLSRLQVLRPALTQASLWWHHELEEQSEAFENSAPKVKAVLAHFWYDLQSVSRSTPTLFDRKLSEYLRGERIRDLRSPKPRLLDFDDMM
jgi:hypothetical protein